MLGDSVKGIWAKSRIQHVTYVSSRRTCQEVPYQGGSGGSLFLLPCYKKSSKRVPKKGPWTGRYHSLTFWERSTFESLKIKSAKLPVDSSREAALRSSRQKSIISPTHGHSRTDGRTDIRFGCAARMERALRTKIENIEILKNIFSLIFQWNIFKNKKWSRKICSDFFSPKIFDQKCSMIKSVLVLRSKISPRLKKSHL